jgi:hypothetical protein
MITVDHLRLRNRMTRDALCNKPSEASVCDLNRRFFKNEINGRARYFVYTLDGLNRGVEHVLEST